VYPEIKYLAANVRRLRTELGLSQAQLAESAGCGQQVVARMERADNAATIVTLLRVAQALETPVAALFEPAQWTPPVRGRPKT
jgi:transcriptional regulator with XRE-family HTH domain